MLAAPVWRGAPELALGVGLFVGASLTSMTSVAVGSLLRLPVPHWFLGFLTVGLTLIMMARELGIISFRLPENARLIPYTVFRFGRLVGSFQFGMELGTGFRTYVTSSLPYALIGALALRGSASDAIIAAGGFAVGRLVMTAISVRFNARAGDTVLWSDVWDTKARLFQSILTVIFVLAIVAIVLHKGGS